MLSIYKKLPKVLYKSGQKNAEGQSISQLPMIEKPEKNHGKEL